MKWAKEEVNTQFIFACQLQQTKRKSNQWNYFSHWIQYVSRMHAAKAHVRYQYKRIGYTHKNWVANKFANGIDTWHSMKRAREREKTPQEMNGIWLIFKLLLTNIETANNDNNDNNKKREADWNKTATTTTTLRVTAIEQRNNQAHKKKIHTLHVTTSLNGIITRTRIITYQQQP